MSWYVVCLLYLLLDPFLVGGFINPSEKYESQLEWLFPIYGQIKFHGSKPPIRFDSHLQWTSAILMTTWRILKDQTNQKLLNTRTNPPWSMWFLGTWSHSGHSGVTCVKKKGPLLTQTEHIQSQIHVIIHEFVIGLKNKLNKSAFDCTF